MTPLEQPEEAIAIVGMAGRFPGAADIEEFWRNLRDGVESISFFKDEELQWSPLAAPPRPGDPRIVKARGVLGDAEGFDAFFFGVTPKEAELMDPQHRVFLELCWTALENAGCNPEAFDGLIGVYAGSGQNTYLLWNLAVHGQTLARFGGHQTLLANEKDYLPIRVSYKLNLRGPSVAIQTACSTSLVAICSAAQSLLSYQCDVALAGGVSISYPLKEGWIFEEGGIFSRDGHCRAFDADSAGTVPGDGAGVVVLKRLSEALGDGDAIWAVIKGCAVNNDGFRKIGFTAPSIEGQAEVIALAQAAAGVEPETVSYVEAHGTATPLGDPIELAGLSKAFGDTGAGTRSCAIGSVKTNVGHLNTAAGVAGLIKTALALRYRQMPPSLHFKSPNPEIRFADGPFYVNDRLREWKAGATPRRAGVSSFGFGGTNAHVVLEEAPAAGPSFPGRPWQSLVLSAKTKSALEAMTERLAGHLERNPDLDPADVAFTLQAGRKAFAHRRALACRGAADAVAALRARDPLRIRSGRAAEKEPAIAFMFPGAGAQHEGMARELYRSEAVFREQFDRCCEILRGHLDFDLRGAIFTEGSDGSNLARTIAAQPALFVVEYALAQLWFGWGIRPQAMIGHSLGEYTAACLAGVFTLEEALALVVTRARLIERQPPGAMLAVRLSEGELTSLLPRGVSIAAVNAKNQCVASGPADAIDALSARLSESGSAFRRLATSHAFHSEMMDGALKPFVAELRKFKLNAPRIPYVSNLTGRLITSAEATDPDYWGRHLRQGVRFADGVCELAKEPRRVFLEVGPGRNLSAMARTSLGPGPAVVASLGANQTSEGSPGDAAMITDALGQLWIAGAPVNWQGLQTGARRRRVPLPSYPFERKQFRLGDVANEPAGLAAARLGPDAPALAAVPAANGEGTLATLKALFQELSGVDLSDSPASASFLELGFDSLFLTQASRAVENRFGVAITFRQLLEEHSTLEKLAAKLDAGSTPGSGVGISASPLPGAQPPKAGQPAPADMTIPLTEEQQEIWFASQIAPGASAAYNQACVVRLRGTIDRPALQRAFRQLLERHEALRITVEPSGERQRIAGPTDLDIPLTDLANGAGESGEERAARIIAGELEPPFDLGRGPLIRARLIRLAEDHHLLVLGLHHIICDGWTLGLLATELGELYSAACLGAPCALPPPVKFSDFVRRQAARSASAEFTAAETHWLGQFSDGVPVLNLPADRPRPASRTFAGAQKARTLGAAAVDAVRRLSAERGSTAFTILFAAFNVLVHRLSGQDDIVVGVPVTAQVFEGAERLAGHCVNLLPFRSRGAGGQSFTEYLAKTRDAIWAGFENRHYPFGRLSRKLKISRGPDRVPLCNVTFSLAKRRGVLAYGDLAAEAVMSPRRFVNFDLSFDFTETEEEFILDCRYSSELFDEPTIGRLIGQYEALLEEIGANPDLALPGPAAPEKTSPDRREVRPAPRSLAEKTLARIWLELLPLSSVALSDDFFKKGGDPELARELLVRVEQNFGIALPLQSLSEASTLSRMAAVIEEAVTASVSLLEDETAQRALDDTGPASSSERTVENTR